MEANFAIYDEALLREHVGLSVRAVGSKQAADVQLRKPKAALKTSPANMTDFQLVNR